jgi:hypothetical protein
MNKQLPDLVIAVRRRHDLLSQSDWTELPSNQARKSPEWAAAWAAYRQALRDLDLNNPVWPARPNL